jgi:hypothetical protein
LKKQSPISRQKLLGHGVACIELASVCPGAFVREPKALAGLESMLGFKSVPVYLRK